MFENIIGHDDIVRTLRAELAGDRFPRASLFFGPPYGGKLSIALEAARVRTCRGPSADWGCECPSCRLQKELAHPHTVLLGSRYCDVEIAACADALMRGRRSASQYLFLRAVRKLTRRFDPAIFEADDARARTAQEKVARVEELLDDVVPGRELPDEKKLGSLLEQVITAAQPLAAQVRGDTISIGQVRMLAAWAHLTAGEGRKVAIVENVDRMQESARNALLKLLEEPPASVDLILLSTRRAAIIPTILSRLRPYAVGQRTGPEEREVIAKIFRQDAPEGGSLRGFFLAWREINPEKLAAVSRRFMDLVRDAQVGGTDIVGELSELIPERRAPRDRSQKETLVSFLEELTERFHEALRGGGTGIDVLEGWSRAVRDALARLETYNLSPSTVLEALFYTMRDSARGPVSPRPAGESAP